MLNQLAPSRQVIAFWLPLVMNTPANQRTGLGVSCCYQKVLEVRVKWEVIRVTGFLLPLSYRATRLLKLRQTLTTHFVCDLSFQNQLEFEFKIWIFKLPLFFSTSSWLSFDVPQWVWYQTPSFAHSNARSDVTFAHFELISPDFRYFFESVTTMVGGSVLLAVCASPCIPPNTSSWTKKTRLAGCMWSLRG